MTTGCGCQTPHRSDPARQEAGRGRAGAAAEFAVPLEEIRRPRRSAPPGAARSPSRRLRAGDLPGARDGLHLAALRVADGRRGAVSALLLDLVLTAGVYSLVGFEVTPSTVIGLLTILGFSLYDIVVVFDKVQENTRGHHRAAPPDVQRGDQPRRQPDAHALDQHRPGRAAARRAACSSSAPACSAPGTLKDLGLVLFVGIVLGAYSSIMFAPPVLVELKEQEPRIQAHGAAGAGPRRAATAAATSPARAPGAARVRTLRPTRSPRRRLARPPPRSATAAGREARPATTAGAAARGAGAGPAPARAPESGPTRPAAFPAGTGGAAPGRWLGERRDAPVQRARRRRGGTPPRAAREPAPRRPRLPQAGHRLQGHQAAARRPRRARRRPSTASPSPTRPTVDLVAGIEARGLRARARPIAVRARRRLRAGAQGRASCPGRSSRGAYALEYGEATLEVHTRQRPGRSAGARGRRRARHRAARPRRRAGPRPARRRHGRRVRRRSPSFLAVARGGSGRRRPGTALLRP